MRTCERKKLYFSQSLRLKSFSSLENKTKSKFHSGSTIAKNGDARYLDSLVRIPFGEENLCGCLLKKKSELSFKGVRQCGIVPRYRDFIKSVL